MTFNRTKFEPAPTLDGMAENISYHTVNIIFGATCFIFNIPLFLIFVTSEVLRKRFQVLIALNIADALNCLAIFFMGLNRVHVYSEVLDSSMIPVRTAWECATEPWLLLRGVGDLWPPVLQFIMGAERLIAVTLPILYKKLSSKRTLIMVLPSILFVIISLLVGFAIAFLNRNEKVKYYCGRKAAFSNEYGVFIYMTNIVGYAGGLLFNVIAVVKALSAISLSGQQQLRRIRYTLVISLLSTILVSIPNAISVLSALFVNIADAISKPSTYFTCINSGLNIFIYFLLNVEFRQRVLEVLRIRKAPYVDSSKMFVSSTSRIPPTKSARTAHTLY